MDSEVARSEEKTKIAQKASMRFDALYNLIAIKRFTKSHLFRVVYSDSKGDLVSANALKLEYSFSFRRTSPECEGWIEIVYVYIDAAHGHFINRSQVFLESNDAASSDCYIKHEHLLSSIAIQNLDVLIDLFSAFQDNNSFNLTHLRKVASSKSLSKTSEILSDASNIRHVVCVQLWTKTVLLVHKCYNNLDGTMISCEYLIKNDILSYVDFLKITSTVMKLENDQYFGYNEELLYTSLAKLSAISDNLHNNNRKKTKRSCKQEISYETSSSLMQSLSELYKEQFL
jgi:hypothetical protein